MAGTEQMEWLQSLPQARSPQLRCHRPLVMQFNMHQMVLWYHWIWTPYWIEAKSMVAQKDNPMSRDLITKYPKSFK